MMKEEICFKYLDANSLGENRSEIEALMKDSAIVNFKDYSFDSEARYDKMLDYFLKGSARIVGAFLGQELIAYMWFFPIREKSIHLNEIAVDKKFRNKHIGQKLIGIMEKYAMENGFKDIELHCVLENKAAYEFYCHNDYKLEDELMRKVLND